MLTNIAAELRDNTDWDAATVLAEDERGVENTAASALHAPSRGFSASVHAHEKYIDSEVIYISSGSDADSDTDSDDEPGAENVGRPANKPENNAPPRLSSPYAGISQDYEGTERSATTEGVDNGLSEELDDAETVSLGTDRQPMHQRHHN